MDNTYTLRNAYYTLPYVTIMMGFGHYTVCLAQKEKFGENIFEIMTHKRFRLIETAHSIETAQIFNENRETNGVLYLKRIYLTAPIGVGDSRH